MDIMPGASGIDMLLGAGAVVAPESRGQKLKPSILGRPAVAAVWSVGSTPASAANVVYLLR